MCRNRKEDRVGVLDGYRVLCVFLVANYHFWQQSWISQSAVLFGQTVSWDFITRSSYVLVDGMILLSGFLLYLPFVPIPGQPCRNIPLWPFYRKRLIRIVPSYLAAVLIAFFCFALPQGAYTGVSEALTDLAAHLTFTFLFNRSTYLYTPLNGALWTIAVEMQWYLLFPFFARAAQKKAGIVLPALAIVGILYRVLVCKFVSDTAMWLNQLPAFLDVFALGMLGAVLYRRIQTISADYSKGQRIAVSTAAVGLSVLCLILFGKLLYLQSANGSVGQTALRLSQMTVRLPLAVLLLLTVLCMTMWPRFIQKLADNRLARFLAGISMNLYIWHQILAVQMRKAWFADVNVLHSDPSQQICYTVLCWSVSLIAASAATFLIEKPASRLIDKLFPISKGVNQ